MAVNLDGNDGNHCGTPYSIALFTTADCSDAAPVNVAASSCYTAPQGQTWFSYSAVPVEPVSQ